ncbi:MAG: hypothetical protein HQK51_16055 [Oligoflexia bacterium]|nr:hypothetical protein [Oligoflexia bacterium]
MKLKLNQKFLTLNYKYHNLILSMLTLLYLSLPYFRFFIGFLIPLYSIPFTITLLLALFFIFKKLKLISFAEYDNKNYKVSTFTFKDILPILVHFIFSFILAFIWLYLSGSGGFSFQNSDYIKHNFVLNDLIYLDWPPKYFGEIAKQNYSMIYSIAYYLPASIIGKLYDIYTAQFFLFIWSYIGVVLIFLWLHKLLQRNFIFIPLIFIIFSGLDVVGDFVKHENINRFLLSQHIEWWATLWQYSSNTTLLFWVPQHSIPSQLITALILNSIISRSLLSFSITPFLISLSLLWSPWISFGILPFFAYEFFQKVFQKNSKTLMNKLSIFFNFENIFTSTTITLLIALYYSSNTSKGQGSFMFNIINNPTTFYDYIKFISLEYLIYILIFLLSYISIYIYYRRQHHQYQQLHQLEEYKNEKQSLLIIIIATITLAFIPFYHLGIFNDFCMRTSIPALFILSVFIIRSLLHRHNHFLIKSILLVTIIIGSFAPYIEIRKSIRLRDVPAIFMHLTQYSPGYSVQYLGKADSLFFKTLCFQNLEHSPLILPYKLEEAVLNR